MKCPFRVKTIKGKNLDGAETIQEFEECYGEECAAARIVQHSEGGGKWRAEVVGCDMMKN